MLVYKIRHSEYIVSRRLLAIYSHLLYGYRLSVGNEKCLKNYDTEQKAINTYTLNFTFFGNTRIWMVKQSITLEYDISRDILKYVV